MKKCIGFLYVVLTVSSWIVLSVVLIASVIESESFAINGSVLSLYGLLGSYVAYIGMIVKNIKDYKMKKSEKNIKIWQLILSAGGSLLWGIIASNTMHDLTNWPSYVVMAVLSFMILVVVAFQRIGFSRVGLDFKYEMKVAKSDERIIANGYKAGHYVMITMIVTLFISVFLLVPFADDLGPLPFIVILGVIFGAISLYFALILLFNQKDSIQFEKEE